MATMNPAEVAEEVVAARKAGYARATVNGVVFATIEKGYCSRFVRLCHLAAGLPTAAFGCCAHSTAQHLRGEKRDVNTPARGDIAVFTNSGPRCSVCGQAVWHIAVYLGNGMVAENTSSSTRGDPRAAGTKITPLEQIGISRIWGYFSLQKFAQQAAYHDGPVVVKIADTPFNGELRDGVTYLGALPVRELTRVGAAVYDHIPDERTVYVYKR